jgi:hypothetical protein
MPLVSKTFDQLLDFTRTTAATFVGSNGLIQNTAASRNLLLQTQQFDNAAWTKNNTTVTANTIVAPDDTSTADSVIQTAATAAQYITTASAISATSGVTYTFSFFAKQGTTRYVQATYSAGAFGSTQYANIDLQTGVVTASAGGVTVSVTAADGGWWRVVYTATASSTATGSPFVWSINSGTDGRSATITGSTSNIYYLWGAQMEVGSTATTYTRNNGGVFPPRFDYDPVTLAPKGILIEEQRVNVLLRSEEFDNATWSKVGITVTANATVSPDGVADADALVEDAATSTHFCQQFFTGFTSGVAYTFSIYVKPSTRTWAQLFLPAAPFGVGQGSFFDLTGNGALGNVVGTPTSRTITAVGNGWYRITITATATATAGGNCGIYAASANGTLSYAGVAGAEALYLYGAQIEAGAFPTSYIPTVASQVTRTADQTSIVAPNFAPWYNQSEGTFVVEATTGGDVASAGYSVAALNAASSSIVGFDIATSGDYRFRVTDTSVNSAIIQVVAVMLTNTTYKTAGAYKASDFAATANGGAVVTDTTGTVPSSMVSLAIGSGSSATGALSWNGHIRSIRYYPVRLSNAQLQALTA